MTTLALFVSHCPMEWQWLLVPWFLYSIVVSFLADHVPLVLRIAVFDELLKYISRYSSHIAKLFHVAKTGKIAYTLVII